MTLLEMLERVGVVLCGPDWQRPMARLLGPHHPDGARDSIDDRLVRRWRSGERAVPEWVRGALLRLLNQAAKERRVEAPELEGLARSLETRKAAPRPDRPGGP